MIIKSNPFISFSYLPFLNRPLNFIHFWIKNGRFTSLFWLFFHGFFGVGIKFCHNRGKKIIEKRYEEKREKYWVSMDLLLSSILDKPNDGKG